MTDRADPPRTERGVPWHPRTKGGMFYLCIVITHVVAWLVVATGNWRIGLMIMGASLLIGAGVRAVLGQREAGMLRVRDARWLDVLMLMGVGAALIGLAISIPNQPG